jgi:hypothetical protein
MRPNHINSHFGQQRARVVSTNRSGNVRSLVVPGCEIPNRACSKPNSLHIQS